MIETELAGLRESCYCICDSGGLEWKGQDLAKESGHNLSLEICIVSKEVQTKNRCSQTVVLLRSRGWVQRL